MPSKKLKEGHTHNADQLHSIILSARESILRARDGGTYRFNMKCFLPGMEADFSIGRPSF